VQVIFPGTGLLVLSAWCLGILNSHHKFFLSYVAPVLSSASVVAILVLFRHEPLQSKMAMYAAWGLVIGSAAQFLVQLPTALKLAQGLKFRLSLRLPAVREILRNFAPVVVSRGVVQVSAYVDSILASFLPSGAVAVLGYSQVIYMLPISLFGMSISAAELPVMSRSFGEEDFSSILKNRIDSAGRRIAFFVVPSVVGFLLLGDVIAGLLFQTGQFDRTTAVYVWMVLAGSAVGLLASTLGRLYSSAFYSLRDTRTPLLFSVIRVFVTTVLGYLMGLKLPIWLGIEGSWGTAGLTASAGIAGWLEFYLLRHSLNKRIGPSGIPFIVVAKLWLAALLSGGAGFLVKTHALTGHPFLRGVLVLGVFGLCYFPLSALFGLDEARYWLKRSKGILRQ
jgi:putative peptidoglycan lipid II flippase